MSRNESDAGPSIIGETKTDHPQRTSSETNLRFVISANLRSCQSAESARNTAPERAVFGRVDTVGEKTPSFLLTMFLFCSTLEWRWTVSFFDEAQLIGLKIEHMVFHLVGPKDEDLICLESLDPAGFSEFFLDRIRSVNFGLPYLFSNASATRERLNRIAQDGRLFQEESERLAEDFQRKHGGSAAAGAVLMFMLDVNGAKSFAILKYDDEQVLAYDVKEAADGRKRVSLEALERTFVQNKWALQKSALIRLSENGGELTILDRRNQQKVARYFENFLDAVRVHQDEDLTAKLVDVTRKVIRSNKDLVPPEVFREVTKRTYDAAAAGGKIDVEDQKAFLDSVMGRKLPDDDPLVAKFRSALRSARIDGTPVALTATKVTRPAAVRYKTVNGIQIRVPKDVSQFVQVEDNRIIINDKIETQYDDADANF